MFRTGSYAYGPLSHAGQADTELEDVEFENGVVEEGDTDTLFVDDGSEDAFVTAIEASWDDGPGEREIAEPEEAVDEGRAARTTEEVQHGSGDEGATDETAEELQCAGVDEGAADETAGGLQWELEDEGAADGIPEEVHWDLDDEDAADETAEELQCDALDEGAAEKTPEEAQRGDVDDEAADETPEEAQCSDVDDEAADETLEEAQCSDVDDEAADETPEEAQCSDVDDEAADETAEEVQYDSVDEALDAGDDSGVLLALHGEVTTIADGVYSGTNGHRPEIWQAVRSSSWFGDKQQELGLEPLDDFYALVELACEEIEGGTPLDELRDTLEGLDFPMLLMSLRYMFMSNIASWRNP